MSNGIDIQATSVSIEIDYKLLHQYLLVDHAGTMVHHCSVAIAVPGRGGRYSTCVTLGDMMKGALKHVCYPNGGRLGRQVMLPLTGEGWV